MRTAILCDRADEARVKTFFQQRTDIAAAFTSVSITALANGPALRQTVRKLACSGEFDVFCNWCYGTLEDEDRASALQVAELLESAFHVPYAGCRVKELKLTRGDLRMMAIYADIPVPNFIDVERGFDTARLQPLSLPILVESADSNDAPLSKVVAERDSLLAEVSEALRSHAKLILSETSLKAQEDVLSFVVVAMPGKKHRVLGLEKNATAKRSEAAVERIAAAVAQSVLGGHGYCKVLLVRSPSQQEAGSESDDTAAAWVLRDIQCNCDVLDVVDAALVAHLLEEARAAHAAAQRNYHVVFDARTKGYHLRAARDIAKGDIVFGDEGRAFSVVTKPYVDKHWSDADKVVFSRYAWPLDSDGHVYAIWEEDPKRWRPINHACDPSCINDESHSLNVIAARTIAGGEDLTMDYAAFCDFTMKPFHCHCGSEKCRGLIRPDEASLSKYKDNAWHRRAPAELPS